MKVGTYLALKRPLPLQLPIIMAGLKGMEAWSLAQVENDSLAQPPSLLSVPPLDMISLVMSGIQYRLR